MSINKVVVFFSQLDMALSTHQLDSNQDIGSLFFKHPSNIFISGPSGSGKTEFVKKMIEFKEDLFDILPNVLFGVTRNGKNLIISYKNVKGQISNLFKVFLMMKMRLSPIPVHRTW